MTKEKEKYKYEVKECDNCPDPRKVMLDRLREKFDRCFNEVDPETGICYRYSTITEVEVYKILDEQEAKL